MVEGNGSDVTVEILRGIRQDIHELRQGMQEFRHDTKEEVRALHGSVDRLTNEMRMGFASMNARLDFTAERWQNHEERIYTLEQAIGTLRKP